MIVTFGGVISSESHVLLLIYMTWALRPCLRGWVKCHLDQQFVDKFNIID